MVRARTANSLYAESHGSGPDVLLIHGWGMHSGVWRPFALDLASRGYRVTLVDLPGHGRSGMLDDYSLGGLSDAVSAVAPARCHLIGWSLGGSIACLMASKSPTRFMTLTMVASNVRFCGDRDWPGMDLQVMESFAQEVLTDHQRALMRFFGLQTWGMEDAKIIIQLLKERVEECEAPEAAALFAGLEILRLGDLRRELQSLQVPPLALLGAKDRLVPVAVGRAMQQLQDQCCVHVLLKSAHIPFVTEGQECLDTIERFWRDSARADVR